MKRLTPYMSFLERILPDLLSKLLSNVIKSLNVTMYIRSGRAVSALHCSKEGVLDR